MRGGYACVHRYLAGGRVAAVLAGPCCMHMCACVHALAVLCLAHADLGTEGSALCGSLDSFRSDCCQLAAAND